PSELIVNVSGATVDDYAETARRLASLEKVNAIEVNISCPNVKEGGMAFGTTTQGAATVTKAVREAYPKNLIVKLSPNVTSIAEIAKAVEAEGADSVSLINTLMGMSIDVERRKPHLSTITGGLSGPAVRPIAVRMVWQVAKAVKIPVIGLGGIMNGRDAIEFMLAGATAVEIGTANFIDPSVTMKIIDYMEDYCSRHGISDINEIIGTI
ncbi:MAG: dihydroorotate dehydrogenase, partial [Duncaniella sp.]|nr:dihydroorotate dehydrogenase [Duncaniella sp.]